MQGIAIALKCGATKAQFDSTVSKHFFFLKEVQTLGFHFHRFDVSLTNNQINIVNKTQVGIHPSSAEEFVTMRSVTRRIAYKSKPKTNL